MQRPSVGAVCATAGDFIRVRISQGSSPVSSYCVSFSSCAILSSQRLEHPRFVMYSPVQYAQSALFGYIAFGSNLLVSLFMLRPFVSVAS